MTPQGCNCGDKCIYMFQKNGDEENSGAIAMRVQDVTDFMFTLKNTKETESLTIHEKDSWDSEDTTDSQSNFWPSHGKLIRRRERDWAYPLQSFNERVRISLTQVRLCSIRMRRSTWRSEQELQLAGSKNVHKTTGTYQNTRYTFFKAEIGYYPCTPGSTQVCQCT